MSQYASVLSTGTGTGTATATSTTVTITTTTVATVGDATEDDTEVTELEPLLN